MTDATPGFGNDFPVAAGLAARLSRFGPGVDLLVFARGGSMESLRAVFEASVKEQDIPKYLLSSERRRQLELENARKPKVWGKLKSSATLAGTPRSTWPRAATRRVRSSCC